MKPASPILYAGLAVTVVLVCLLFNASFQRAAAQADQRGQGVKPPSQERRVALVIGNGAYADSPLENPLKDARGLAAALRELGFDVLAGENAKRDQMLQLLRSFGERLRGGGVGLFYFAGHGVQVNGVNYLIPIGADIKDEPDVSDQSVSVEAVLNRMEAADNRVNLVILDACRDNPFRSFRRLQSRGLAHVQAPSGTLIAYATQPGNTAADGKGRPNSPYTTSLLQHIRTPGLKIEDFFKRVRVSVEDLTARKQTPWEHSSLRGDFYFAAPKPEPGGSVPVYGGEQAYWRAIEESSEAQDFRDYLKQYPNGIYVAAARVKLRRLEAAGTAATVTPPNNTNAASPKPTSTAVYAKVAGPPVPLVKMSFTTAKVDAHGNMTKFPGQPVNGFVEELGNGVKLEMVELPAGTFDMGSPSTEAQRKDNEMLRRGVRVNAFYMGKYEVTQAQWKAVMGSNPSTFKGSDLPVETVSWNDAAEFCQKLSARTGREYWLPTEAEWEYAARAGTQTPFAFGETITPEVVNYDGNYSYGNAAKGVYRQKTMAVGSLGVANAWGLFDLHGNVWEWCQDWYGSYEANQLDNPKGPSSGQYRMARGGSWNDFSRDCRAAVRGSLGPGARFGNIGGFRVVVSARIP
jgi:formylglycine-generating enzyme required for sulfatase activity